MPMAMANGHAQWTLPSAHPLFTLRYSCLSALLYRAAVKPSPLMASTTSLGPSRDVSDLNTWVNT